MRAATALVAILVGAGTVAVPVVRADSPAECAPGTVDRFRLLRQLSLDLYGRPPTVDEYEAVRARPDVGVEDLQAMMASDEYFAQVREYHRALLWGGLAVDFDLAPNARRLRRFAAGGQGTADDLWRQPNLRNLYRGRNNVECLDQEQVEFDAAGRPVPLETFADATCRNGTCVREGFVRVRPYWDPNVDYKVCAFDAQALARGVGNNVACGPFATNAAGNPVNDAGCGCGEGLRYCLPEPNHPAHVAMRSAIVDEPLRIFEQVVRAGQPYFDAFTTRTTFLNGPLRAFYDHVGGPAVPLRAAGSVGYQPRIADLPDLPFGDQTWMPVTRDDVHAGVLTTAGYHLRLATNRARVNRFYTAFRCEPFLPPAEGLPADVGGVPEPDLRIRPGCASCHATLEVSAAYWGRWRTTSTFGYFDPAQIDLMGPFAECRTCTTCSAFCNQYFITPQTSTNPAELEAWRGYHRSRIYLSEQEAAAMAVGPGGLVDDADEQARIATCTVRTLAEQRFNRPLTDDEILDWLPAQTRAFADSGYRFDELERAILSSPTYRTLR